MASPVKIVAAFALGITAGGLVALLAVLDLLPVPFGPMAEARAAREKAKPPETVVVPLQERILNLADRDKQRYLKVQLALELVEPKGGGAKEGQEGKEGGAKAPPTLEAEKPGVAPVIVDAVASVFSGKTAAELLTPAGKERAKAELIERLNQLLHGEEQVKGVYFQTFVIQ